jgi:hypothetical protein
MEACLSIVLHQFTAWAGYDDGCNYQGQKYHVQRIQKGAKDDIDEIHRRREERRRKLQRQQEEMAVMEREEGGMAGFLLLGPIGTDKNDGDY